MKIAIVGLGPGNESAPFGDWECWALLNDAVNRSRADALFQMHERDIITIPEGIESPVYWQYEARESFRTYPLDEVVSCIGHDWFDSTIAYMTALAISREPEAIGLWGVHMASETEYFKQRANLCWLLGLAEGRGIEVSSHLLSRAAGSKYPVRYGYL